MEVFHMCGLLQGTSLKVAWECVRIALFCWVSLCGFGPSFGSTPIHLIPPIFPLPGIAHISDAAQEVSHRKHRWRRGQGCGGSGRETCLGWLHVETTPRPCCRLWPLWVSTQGVF